MARELFDLWNTVCLRVVEFIRWELVPQPDAQPIVQRNESHCPAGAGNIDRVRRRWLRAHASLLSETIGPIALEAGTALPASRIRAQSNLSWGIGIRLGPKASGAAPNYSASVASTPPAMRKTSPRELMVFLQAEVQIGYPPSMSADAALAFSRIAHQGAVIAMTECAAGEFVLARLDGAVAKAHAPKKSDLARIALGVRARRTLPFRRGTNWVNSAGSRSAGPTAFGGLQICGGF